MSAATDAMEARARKQCTCRQCSNPQKHPCGHVLSVAIPFAVAELARGTTVDDAGAISFGHGSYRLMSRDGPIAAVEVWDDKWRIDVISGYAARIVRALMVRDVARETPDTPLSHEARSSLDRGLADAAAGKVAPLDLDTLAPPLLIHAIEADQQHPLATCGIVTTPRDVLSDWDLSKVTCPECLTPRPNCRYCGSRMTDPPFSPCPGRAVGGPCYPVEPDDYTEEPLREITLSKDGAKRVLELIDAPPEPSERLRAAMALVALRSRIGKLADSYDTHDHGIEENIRGLLDPPKDGAA